MLFGRLIEEAEEKGGVAMGKELREWEGEVEWEKVRAGS